MVWLVLLALLMGGSAAGWGHELRPAYFQINETRGELHLTWKQPVRGDMALKLVPRLSSGWLARTPVSSINTGDYLIRQWRIPATEATALHGTTFRVEGLEKSIAEVMVRVDTPDMALTAVLTPAAPQLVLVEEQGASVPAYLGMGFDHILEGVDHLAFVLGLILLVGFRRRLIWAVTAFTLAHCLTLYLVTAGVFLLPSPVVETLVAISIVFLAREVIRRRRGGTSLAIRYPAVLAFLFGLIHGFAFAGALADIGFPKEGVWQALLLFNLGVELGQIAFVAAVFATMIAWHKIVRLTKAERIHAAIHPLAAPCGTYAIGSYAAFLVLQRLPLIVQ